MSVFIAAGERSPVAINRSICAWSRSTSRALNCVPRRVGAPAAPVSRLPFTALTSEILTFPSLLTSYLASVSSAKTARSRTSTSVLLTEPSPLTSYLDFPAVVGVVGVSPQVPRCCYSTPCHPDSLNRQRRL